MHIGIRVILVRLLLSGMYLSGTHTVIGEVHDKYNNTHIVVAGHCLQVSIVRKDITAFRVIVLHVTDSIPPFLYTEHL